MKRVLTLATTGFFMLGLAVLPFNARAGDAMKDGAMKDGAMKGKDGKDMPAAASSAPMKMSDEHKVTVVPPAGGTATVTAPAGGTAKVIAPTGGTATVTTPAGGTATVVPAAKPPVKSGS